MYCFKGRNFLFWVSFDHTLIFFHSLFTEILMKSLKKMDKVVLVIVSDSLLISLHFWSRRI